MISVALASCNGMPFLEEQIDSILRQTYSHIELVVCDDCSTDATWDVLLGYTKEDPRVRAYRNEKRLGVVRNFEKAISLCQGDYVALSDQDDVWLPNHISLLLENIGNKDISCGNAKVLGANGKLANMTMKGFSHLDYVPDDDLEKAWSIIFYRNAYQGSTMMLRKSFIQKALPIPDGTYLHDAWFAHLACFCQGISYFDDVISLYRRHGDNVSPMKRINLLPHIVALGAQMRPRNTMTYNKERIIDHLIEVLTQPTPEQSELLRLAKVFYLRKNTFFGRLKNFRFQLRHFNKIFSVKG